MIISPVQNKNVGEKAVEVMCLTEAYYLFAEEYIWLHGYTDKTANNYRWAINSFVKAVGDLEITEINQDHIKMWRKYMDQHQYEIGAVNAFLYRMRKFLDFFSTRYALAINPQEIIIPKKKKPIPKYLSIEEVHKLIEVAELREKSIYSLLYASGIRIGELTKLRKTDVYGDTIKVRGKGGRDRIAFLDKTSQRLLKSYLESRSDACPFLFYSKKCKGLGVTRIQDLIRRDGISAGIEKTVTPHVLRHSFATHMIQNGCGGFHLQQLLGHADISTTQIYVHLGSRDLRKAYSQFHNA